MSSRARTAASGVLSFTFLDVLMCTMGSLLLLLTVLAKRAELGLLSDPGAGATPAPQSAATANARPAALASVAPGVSKSDEADAKTLAARLAEARRAKQQLDSVLAKAIEAQQQEQARLAHLEEHQRRLQHELAQLHISMLRLKETEERGFVDQQQADKEAERLEGLVRDLEKELEKSRKEAQDKRSYAIVPYKGKNGTFRRPIFVECVDGGAIIQPEGVRFSMSDLSAASPAGNPLTAAIRAAREELDRRAVAAGAESPNAYPVLVVRPNGSAAFYASQLAVNNWNADYGYQLIEQDWSLHFDEPDPGLAQVMEHAASLAKERQELLARMAPGRYGRSEGSGGSGRYGQSRGPGGTGAHGGSDRTGRGAGGTMTAGGASAQSWRPTGVAGPTTGPRSSDQADHRYGEIVGKHAPQKGAQSTFAQQVAAASLDPRTKPENNADSSVADAADGRDTTRTNQQTGALPTASVPLGKKGRAANWANSEIQPHSSPVTRPIRVTIRRDELLVIPFDPSDATSQAGGVVSFDQSTSKVLDGLAGAVGRQIGEWGSAGIGMYWRPTLIFDVAPGAEPHALRLARLLDDSGLDIRLPVGLQTAERAGEEVRR